MCLQFEESLGGKDDSRALEEPVDPRMKGRREELRLLVDGSSMVDARLREIDQEVLRDDLGKSGSG